jgi:hypothetical protein
LISILRRLLAIANPPILSPTQEQLDELFWWAVGILAECEQYLAQRL